MAVKTITITTEAYQAIKGLKREEESFSELFLRIAPKRVTLKDIAGILKHTPEEATAFKQRVADYRKQLGEDWDKRVEDVRTRLKRHHRSA